MNSVLRQCSARQVIFHVIFDLEFYHLEPNMKSSKTVVTITGIRPDFIRMKEVFRRLDENFTHIMIHTGQHYDDSLSQFFFRDLNIRKPDYTMETGLNSTTHYEQLSYLSKEICYLLRREKIRPDLIMFLGDSNSAMVAPVLFKEGYRIGHIEGGMRSYDRRMPEEVNRVLCDYVSDMIFVYTPLYKDRLLKENIPQERVYVVGNTITEIIRDLHPVGVQGKNYIVADIHRSENLKSYEQLNHILTFLDQLGEKTHLPVKLVKFNRAQKIIAEHDLLEGKKHIEVVGPYGFLDYLKLQYHCAFEVSDSGTSQEECPLLGIPVVVPRKATERPESVENGNSILIGEDRPVDDMVSDTLNFVNTYKITRQKLAWLGTGQTSETIINILKEKL